MLGNLHRPETTRYCYIILTTKCLNKIGLKWENGKRLLTQKSSSSPVAMLEPTLHLTNGSRHCLKKC